MQAPTSPQLTQVLNITNNNQKQKYTLITITTEIKRKLNFVCDQSRPLQNLSLLNQKKN